MKMIVAIVHPEKLAAVQAALHRRDVHLMTVSEVFDCGREHGPTEIYRGRAFRRPVSRLRLEVAVQEASVHGAVDAIVQAAKGQGEDSEVFVLGLDECVRRDTGGRSTLTVGLNG